MIIKLHYVWKKWLRVCLNLVFVVTSIRPWKIVSVDEKDHSFLDFFSSIPLDRVF